VKLRFLWDAERECYLVRARRKTTGLWETIGTCHALAKQYVKSGRMDLIQFAKGAN
jgi:hypothetical protein